MNKNSDMVSSSLTSVSQKTKGIRRSLGVLSDFQASSVVEPLVFICPGAALHSSRKEDLLQHNLLHVLFLPTTSQPPPSKEKG